MITRKDIRILAKKATGLMLSAVWTANILPLTVLHILSGELVCRAITIEKAANSLDVPIWKAGEDMFNLSTRVVEKAVDAATHL